MGRTLDLPTAAAYLPFLQPARYKVAHGGRGSAKSHEFGIMLLERHMLKPRRSVCIREVQKSLEESVKRLLEDKIKTYGLTYAFDIRQSHIRTPGEGIIIFQGMQDHTNDSIKSLEGYDTAWCEEAQTISERSLELLRPTIRKEEYDPEHGRVVPSEMWFTYNPRFKTDAVDKMFRDPRTRPPDSIVIGTTFKDNPWFPDILRREMEYDRAMDLDKYGHVWLGGYQKRSESRVFKNVRVEEFVTPPNVVFLTGADWGFSVDPTTLVRSFVSERNPLTNELWMWTDPTTGKQQPRKRLYVDQDLYKVGVEIDHIPAFFDTMDNGRMREWPIIADSARPETISYLRRFGYPRMEAAKKGANSVKEGVIFLQGFDIIIHPRCEATIKEFEDYSYKTVQIDGIETVVPVLDDKHNHIIDPLRYAVEQLRDQVRVHKAVWG